MTAAKPPPDSPTFREWLYAQHHPKHPWHGKPWATVEKDTK
jgi:hypothetical protein